MSETREPYDAGDRIAAIRKRMEARAAAYEAFAIHVDQERPDPDVESRIFSECLATRADFELHAPSDIAFLLAEVERLQAAQHQHKEWFLCDECSPRPKLIALTPPAAHERG